jgi:hypothetical protein
VLGLLSSSSREKLETDVFVKDPSRFCESGQWSLAGSKWITRNSQVASIQGLLSQWRAAFPTHLSGGYHRKAKPALARHQHATKSVSRWHTDLLLHARTNGITADADSFSETEEPKSAFSQAHHLQSHATMEDIIASKNSIWWDGQVWERALSVVFHPRLYAGVDGVTTGEDSTLMRQAQNSKDPRALSRRGAYRLGMRRWMALPLTRTHSGEMLRLRRCSLVGTLMSLTCGSGQYHLRCKANAGKELKNSLIGTLCGRRRRMLILPFPRSIAQMKLPTISLTGRLYFFGRTSLILPRNHQTRYQF